METIGTFTELNSCIGEYKLLLLTTYAISGIVKYVFQKRKKIITFANGNTLLNSKRMSSFNLVFSLRINKSLIKKVKKKSLVNNRLDPTK